MRILIIFTGGTIGSSVSDGKISPDSSTKYCLINNFMRSENSASVEFDSIEPYTILSENLCASNINSLISSVRESLKKDYDGIIITHGTDTLQFTAAALGYAFPTPKIPILLVSSNFPLSEKRANGGINFEASVEFIREKAAKGIFVAYANSEENVKYHDANSVLMHAETQDEIKSLNGNYFAEYKNGRVIKNLDYKDCKRVCKCPEFKLTDESKILVVSSYPGESYAYDLDAYRAIILRPYHSGTLNTSDKNLADFCLRAHACGLPVYVINVPGGNIYESSVLYGKLGITPLPESSFADVYMKLWIDLSV